MITQTAGSASGYYGWSPEDWCPPRSYDAAPDGQRFPVIQWPPPSPPPVVTRVDLVQHWA